MKKIAFIVYVGCVLAFSAFARAELALPFSTASTKLVQVKVSNVIFDQSHFDLVIDGYLPTPCHGSPSAVLIQDLENPNVLIVSLTSPAPTQACMSRLEDFRAVVNLPVLAQNSQLRLDDQSVYQIKAQGHKFAMEVRGAELLRVPGFVAL